MDNNIELYLQALQSLKEDDLSTKIIKPLFESMGCYRVDFNGGPYEEGKDIIAYLKAPLEDHVTVIQAKKIGDGKNTTDKTIIGGLIFQLQQCYLKSIPLHDGRCKKPDSVIFATPYKINSRLLAEIHEHLTQMKNEIKLLDGPLLVKLIKENNPSLFNIVMGIDSKILVQDSLQLNNIELMKALNMEYSIGEMGCYNDLAFFMGNIDSHHLLKGEFNVSSNNLSLNKDGWDILKKKYLLKLERCLEFNPLTESVSVIENKFAIRLKEHLSEINKKHYEKIFAAKTEINLLENTLSSIKSELYTFKNQSREVIKISPSVHNLMSIWWPIICDAHTTSDYIKIYSDYYDLLAGYKKELDLPSGYAINFADYTSTLYSLNKQVENLHSLESEYIHYPLYHYQFDNVKIEAWIRSHRGFYIEGIAKINNKNYSENKDYLRAFLINTQKTLSALEILKEISLEIHNVITFHLAERSLKDGISISPFTLFDTNYDIAVYGGAGAGKTTTLQMYAQKLNENGVGNILYLPLNRLLTRQSTYLKNEPDIHVTHKQILALIIISKELDVTEESISNLELALQDKKGLKLVIDGVDEAYNKIPFIIDAINAFKIKYPHVQLIISSRDCVSFISQINFLGVTLLPFTTKQLYTFIKAWLKDNDGEAESLILDIESNDLKEIVKTPLLATLLCILKRRGIDTPSTEMEIFTRRLKLFCGEYDNFKTIKRNTADSTMLEKAAMKIAYHLHDRNKRSDTLESMIAYLQHDSTFTYNNATCAILVNELVNPCNIIHFDPLTKTYSFGHLRFQEHLAALELNENRGRDILPLLKKDWWAGTLCLYAQICDFSSLLEDYYRSYGQVYPVLKIFKEMARHRPLHARAHLMSLIKRYERTDELDSFMRLDDDDESWRYANEY